jgi:hypothetical protein
VSRIGEQEEAMVSFSDVFATITELLGTDLPGGIDNSFSFYPLLSDAEAKTRTFNYSELQDGELDRAIRNEQYKLIIRSDGSEEFFDLIADPFERIDLMQNGLTVEQILIKEALLAEADQIFQSWSCNDQIQNGDEEGIDCGGSSCKLCTVTSNEAVLDNKPEIVLFPNPATETLNINLPPGNFSIRLYNINGILIKNDITAVNPKRLDLTSLAQGVYFLEIMNRESRVVSRKRLIKH